MKFYILILALFFFVSCAAEPPVDKALIEKTKEKNKEIAVKNEVAEITRIAQTIEQRGRDLQPYREAFGAESARQCNSIIEERRKEIANLETRTNNLPETYKNKLTPIIAEINECMSCARKNLDDCKKARASINQLIKEIYP